MTASFYVKDYYNNLVEAKYLYADGAPALDPNASKARSTQIYAANGTLLPQQNTNGYLIVPANYSIEQAETFASSVPDLPKNRFFKSSLCSY